MAKAKFTFDEMVYNSVCAGKQIWYDGDGDETPELKTIDYVKMDKKSRQILVHCDDGDVFTCHQDDLFDFEVNAEKEWKKPTRKRQRGKK